MGKTPNCCRLTKQLPFVITYIHYRENNYVIELGLMKLQMNFGQKRLG